MGGGGGVLAPLLLPLLWPAAVTGACVVEQHRCSFPFSVGGVEHYSCQPSTNNSSLAHHYCYSQVEERHVYGVCNGGCYEEDGVSPIQFEPDDPMAYFCKTASSECQFPFVWEGETYTECTKAGSEFPWCALEVDSSGVLVGNRWGECDLASCRRDPVERVVEVAGGNFVLSQASSLDPVLITGTLQIDPGNYLLSLHAGGCGAPGPALANLTLKAAENETKVVEEVWGVGVLGQSSQPASLRLECEVSDYDSVLVGEAGVEEEDCENFTPVCGEIQQEDGPGLNLTLILIVSLVAFIILVSILLVFLLFCCVRRTCPLKEKAQYDLRSVGSVEDYPGVKRGRSPLYDELSIPFIDASLPPTPRTARTGAGLELLLGRSQASLAGGLEK